MLLVLLVVVETLRLFVQLPVGVSFPGVTETMVSLAEEVMRVVKCQGRLIPLLAKG